MDVQKGLGALALGALLAVQVTACGGGDPGAHRDAAWSERYAGQAAAIQKEAARRERAYAASSERLSEQARAYFAEKARADRAAAAYSERLSKLADYILNGGRTN